MYVSNKMREIFEKKLKKSRENPDKPELIVTKTTTRESNQLNYWLIINGVITKNVLDQSSVREDENGKVSGIVRCSNRFNKALPKPQCAFKSRLVFQGSIKDFTEINMLQSENWTIEALDPKHKLIDPIGRESLAKTKTNKKCCNFSVDGALKTVFNSNVNKLTGKRDNPCDEARNLVMGGERWNTEQVSKVFNMKNAKRCKRRIEKEMGIQSKFLIPEYLHFANEHQIYWPMFRTDQNEQSVEDRQNLYYCHKDWLHHLENARECFVDCTFRACKATEYRQVLVIGMVRNRFFTKCRSPAG